MILIGLSCVFARKPHPLRVGINGRGLLETRKDWRSIPGIMKEKEYMPKRRVLPAI